MNEMLAVIQDLSEESGIPAEQLLAMTAAEFEPVVEFVQLKRELQIAEGQAVIDKLEARLAEIQTAHPLWREHIERTKGGEA